MDVHFVVVVRSRAPREVCRRCLPPDFAQKAQPFVRHLAKHGRRGGDKPVVIREEDQIYPASVLELFSPPFLDRRPNELFRG